MAIMRTNLQTTLTAVRNRHSPGNYRSALLTRLLLITEAYAAFLVL